MRHSWRPVLPLTMGAVLDTAVGDSAARAGAASVPSNTAEPKATRTPADRGDLRKAASVIERSPVLFEAGAFVSACRACTLTQPGRSCCVPFYRSTGSGSSRMPKRP